LFKNKPLDKIILISDSTKAKYLEDGQYTLGDQTIYLKDGAVTTSDGVLAGSVLKLNDALKNIHKVIPSLSFTQLIDLVTKNVANNLRINNIGSIKVNNLARFTVVDEDFNVIKTVF
jgi:N-acetylglucosamine-6-phosphate deacetylase